MLKELLEQAKKTIVVTRVKRSVNGNPRFEVDTFEYPELKTLGSKKRGSNNIRIFSSYNVRAEIQDYYDEEIDVEIV